MQKPTKVLATLKSSSSENTFLRSENILMSDDRFDSPLDAESAFSLDIYLTYSGPEAGERIQNGPTRTIAIGAVAVAWSVELACAQARGRVAVLSEPRR